MTEKKRFRMEIIEGASLPFIVDNDSAKKQSDKITSYHTYKTDKKNKCLELVELLNALHEENEILKKRNNNQYNQLNQLWQLIEAKNWETLTGMVEQMKKDEERLQLSRLLKGRIMLFDDGKAIHRINDIYFDDGAVICKYDKRWEYD